MNELDQLREIVFNNGFDAESREEVLSYEKRLTELAVKENMLSHQPVKEWFDYLQGQVTAARLLLSTDPTLDDKRRAELFIRIELANKCLSLLGHGSDRESLELEIKSALNAAKNQVDA